MRSEGLMGSATAMCIYILLGVCLAGCTTPRNESGSQNAVSPSATTEKWTRLHVYNRLHGREIFLGADVVADDGTFHVPMTTVRIRVAGRPLTQVEREVETVFRDAMLYRSPEVRIEIERGGGKVVAPASPKKLAAENKDSNPDRP